MNPPPVLSVVLATPAGYAALALTIRALAGQTIVRDIELVVVSLGGADLGVGPSELGGFHSVRVVRLPAARTVTAGNAAGTRAAGARLVAFGEDHSYPLPGWGEALVERHAGPWVAVGPVVRNANPRTAVSWADYLLGYAPFMEGGGGEREALPGHNSSYKREVLLGLGDRLEEWLEAEWVLHRDLRARGERLFLEPRAVTRHVNFALLRPWLRTSTEAGRSFAAARSLEWGRGRRILYALGSPAIPVVRAVRTAARLGGARRAGAPLGRALPALALGLTADAAGQLAGYARGARGGGAGGPEEFGRLRFVPPADREHLRRELA